MTPAHLSCSLEQGLCGSFVGVPARAAPCSAARVPKSRPGTWAPKGEAGRGASSKPSASHIQVPTGAS